MNDADPGGGRPPADALIEALESTLARGRPRAFTPDALDVLFERQDEFVQELATTAVYAARRRRSEVMTTADVIEADETVSARTPARRAGFQVFGGLLGGAGLGEFVDVLSDEDPTSLAIALPALVMVVGAVLMTAALPRR